MNKGSDPDTPLDALPAAYAAWRRSTLGRITDDIEERLLLARIGPPRDRHVLDVGCGDGVLASRLAVGGARVTGIDASADMVVAARRRAAAAGVPLELVVAESDRLPFPDAHFDVVCSVAALCFSTHPERPIGEMARVLRPGGRLILGDLGRWNTWAAWRRLQAWLGSSVWRAARFRSRAELEALLNRAGFREIAVTGAIFYPPIGLAARLLAPTDPWLGRWTSVGAAFLPLEATKP